MKEFLVWLSVILVLNLLLALVASPRFSSARGLTEAGSSAELPTSTKNDYYPFYGTYEFLDEAQIEIQPGIVSVYKMKHICDNKSQTPLSYWFDPGVYNLKIHSVTYDDSLDVYTLELGEADSIYLYTMDLQLFEGDVGIRIQS